MLQGNYSPSDQLFQSSSKILTATYLKLITKWKQLWHDGWYNWNASKNSPSFCMTTFSTSLTNITILLPQSHECSYYVSRPMLAPPLTDWIKTDLHAHCFARFPDLSHQPRVVKITCVWRRRIFGITLAVTEKRNW